MPFLRQYVAQMSDDELFALFDKGDTTVIEVPGKPGVFKQVSKSQKTEAAEKVPADEKDKEIASLKKEIQKMKDHQFKFYECIPELNDHFQVLKGDGWGYNSEDGWVQEEEPSSQEPSSQGTEEAAAETGSADQRFATVMNDLAQAVSDAAPNQTAATNERRLLMEAWKRAELNRNRKPAEE